MQATGPYRVPLSSSTVMLKEVLELTPLFVLGPFRAGPLDVLYVNAQERTWSLPYELNSPPCDVSTLPSLSLSNL
jgi:hypothetical protein